MRRTVSALLLAVPATLVPAATPPAQAFPIDGGCFFSVARDRTDPTGRTWIGVTYSYFIGTPDVTSWEVTCWLQTSANVGANEIPGTRHTCDDNALPTKTCVNGMIFVTNATDNVYQCTHLSWTGSFTADPGKLVDDLVKHVIRDVFSTGGATTVGSAAQLFSTVVVASNNLLRTLQDVELPEPGGEPQVHTRTLDGDRNVPGDQCV